MTKSAGPFLIWLVVTMLWALLCARLHLGPWVAGGGGVFLGSSVVLLILGFAIARADRS
jgi:hypothetical protein